MRIGEVMTRHVEVIDSNAPLREAAGKMKTLDVGLIPVCDGDTLRGTLTDRDITVRVLLKVTIHRRQKSPISCQQTLRTATRTMKSMQH
jgi:signal-transduction protein with cAMP-binding, CBS, and nucleotidyltransferase domain